MMGKHVLLNTQHGPEILIDWEDACLCRMFTWTYDGRYVKTKLSGKRDRGFRAPAKVIYIHRLILGVHGLRSEGTHVHHINGNTLDNRRSNIAVVGRTLNNRAAVIYRDKGIRIHG